MKTKGLNKIEILKVDETEDPENQGISEEWGIWWNIGRESLKEQLVVYNIKGSQVTKREQG